MGGQIEFREVVLQRDTFLGIIAHVLAQAKLIGKLCSEVVQRATQVLEMWNLGVGQGPLDIIAKRVVYRAAHIPTQDLTDKSPIVDSGMFAVEKASDFSNGSTLSGHWRSSIRNGALMIDDIHQQIKSGPQVMRSIALHCLRHTSM